MYRKSIIELRLPIERILKIPFRTVVNQREGFNGQYSLKQEEKILSLINEANAELLVKYNFTTNHIKQLEDRLAIRGPFRTLPDILEIEGIDGRNLEEICNSIVSAEKTVKARKQVLSPALTPLVISRLQDVVSIYLSPTGVSWAKISKEENELQVWDFYDFQNVPTKLLPIDSFYLASSILNKISRGCIYVMEASSSSSLPNNKQIPMQTNQLELSSMLLALLNTSSKHNTKPEQNTNVVYFLKHKIPARLFRTLVGNERVATAGIVTQIMEQNSDVVCSKVNICNDLKYKYNKHTSAQKDVLGQALLLNIAFMDLCVYRNANCYAALTPKRKFEHKNPNVKS